LPFLGGGYCSFAYRQLDGVLAEAVEARPGRSGGHDAVQPELAESLAHRPFRQVGVIPLAGDDQGGEEKDGLLAEVAEQTGDDGVGCLGGDGEAAIRAVLDPELDEEETEEMVDLCEGRHGALATAPAGALSDGHRRRDAEDRIHVGPGGGLDELAGIGVEGLQVASLPFGEQDVEGDRALARAGDAGDHREAVPWHGDVDILQVVFPGVNYADGIVICGS